MDGTHPFIPAPERGGRDAAFPCLASPARRCPGRGAAPSRREGALRGIGQPGPPSLASLFPSPPRLPGDARPERGGAAEPPRRWEKFAAGPGSCWVAAGEPPAPPAPPFPGQVLPLAPTPSFPHAILPKNERTLLQPCFASGYPGGAR